MEILSTSGFMSGHIFLIGEQRNDNASSDNMSSEWRHDPYEPVTSTTILISIVLQGNYPT